MAHLIAAAISAHATIAFAANFDPPVTVLSDDNIYTVNRDGTSILDQTVRFRIDTATTFRNLMSSRHTQQLETGSVLMFRPMRSLLARVR